ncbi:hypothetical protein BDZ89DRAFT_1202713, partial [Hymenopellis radicata]
TCDAQINTGRPFDTYVVQRTPEIPAISPSLGRNGCNQGGHASSRGYYTCSQTYPSATRTRTSFEREREGDYQRGPVLVAPVSANTGPLASNTSIADPPVSAVEVKPRTRPQPEDIIVLDGILGDGFISISNELDQYCRRFTTQTDTRRMRESIAKARQGLDEVEKLVDWMDSADLDRVGLCFGGILQVLGRVRY